MQKNTNLFFFIQFIKKQSPSTQNAIIHRRNPTYQCAIKERADTETCILISDHSDTPSLNALLLHNYNILFHRHRRHHIHDLYTHTALVVEHTPADLTLRWAALLHDIGKPATMTMGEDGQAHYHGHAAKSAEMAEAILRRLKAPTALREQVVVLIARHMTLPESDKKYLRRWLGKLGWETLEALLSLQQADTLATGTDHGEELNRFEAIQTILEEIRAENACLSLKDLAINGHDLMALGYQGKSIGTELNRLLELVVEEQCENTRESLLAQCLPLD